MNGLHKLRQWKPLRVWVWKIIAATLTLISAYISVAHLNMHIEFLWLLPIANATIDSLLKTVNTKLLGDLGVNN